MQTQTTTKTPTEEKANNHMIGGLEVVVHFSVLFNLLILQILQFPNYDLDTLETPLDVDKYASLLHETEYDPVETQFLVNGFKQGFDIGYKGPLVRQSESRNIPFSVGNHIEMWNKIMKEVELKRVAGPFDKIPFKNYIQSPIGLVPKAGNKTRLIFHLSYDFKGMDMQSNSVKHALPKTYVQYLTMTWTQQLSPV